AWQQLIGLYGPVVYHWCRRSGLRAEDAQYLAFAPAIWPPVEPRVRAAASEARVGSRSRGRERLAHRIPRHGLSVSRGAVGGWPRCGSQISLPCSSGRTFPTDRPPEKRRNGRLQTRLPSSANRDCCLARAGGIPGAWYYTTFLRPVRQPLFTEAHPAPSS